MQLSRSDPKYDQGVTEFLDYAYSHDKWVEDDMIICPCKDNIATDSSAHHDEDGTDEDGDEDVADEYDANSNEDFY
ncbi:putative Transposase-associated domain-containing protein [Rosa chinensis]|uniref:Putative Transposase-associated domain-containing protein n=1 Tax=Rosa chinensis TaxID=74649 RepID=A0A2P6QF91_ROSCH|nr:putative Transposase-associated domain-containing protein [Rosa chinensis]